MSDAAVLETAFDLLTWRTGLPGTPPVPQEADLADWATWFGSAGYDAASALLANVATIHAGVPAPFADDRAARMDEDMMTRATAELRQLGRAAATDEASTAASAKLSIEGDIGKTARTLRHLLERPLTDKGETLAVTLGMLAARPSIDHRAFAHSALPLLVPAIAGAALIDFAQRMRDLWDAPTGSAILFHRAARLGRGGLGPYFVNVDRLVRHSGDVLTLADIARKAAVEACAIGPATTLSPWIALLSRGCGPALLHELIDDLGDAVDGDALSAVLEHVLARPLAGADPATLMRLRDVGLDNADYPLAVRAQAAVARMRPDSELEIALLGSILVSAGSCHQGRATFQGWLARSPGDGEVRRRLDALNNGSFEPFAVDRGFGSPPRRQISRLHRRGITPDYPRRPGERIDAVEVH